MFGKTSRGKRHVPHDRIPRTTGRLARAQKEVTMTLAVPKGSELLFQTKDIRWVINEDNKIAVGALTVAGMLRLTATVDTFSLYNANEWDIKRLCDKTVYLIVQK